MVRLIRRIIRHLKRYYGLFIIFVCYILNVLIFRSRSNKEIWLVSEKRDEARDNGYHFFKYLRLKHPNINAYYVITKDSPDYSKLLQLGNIIIANSFRHILYYLNAEYSISSQAYGAFPFDLTLKDIERIRKLCNNKQKTIFLQHGIIKDELSHEAFDYEKCNIDYFVCSAPREYKFIKEKYHYPDSAIGCIGLARYDYLLTSHILRDTVLVMPTWRSWIHVVSSNKEPSEEEKNSFLNSTFYKEYAKLLSNSKLISEMKEHNMRVVFYMHYRLQCFSSLMKSFENDTVIIADREHFDVQQLLMESKALITDYSSVFFDFAYMEKPVIHFMFDKDVFESNHYSKGYFEYETDSFGPICLNSNEVVEKTVNYMRNKFIIEDSYRKRVEDFFLYHDQLNCERTYLALKGLR